MILQMAGRKSEGLNCNLAEYRGILGTVNIVSYLCAICRNISDSMLCRWHYSIHTSLVLFQFPKTMLLHVVSTQPKTHTWDKAQGV